MPLLNCSVRVKLTLHLSNAKTFSQIWDIFELIVPDTLVQTANGRRRRAMCALRLSTGAAAASANLPIGSRRSISAAVRVRTLSGVQSSKQKDQCPETLHSYKRKAPVYIYINTCHVQQLIACQLRVHIKSMRIGEQCTHKCACMTDRRDVYFLFLFWIGIGLL